MTFDLDQTSLLVTLDGATTLGTAEDTLAARGLTLDIDDLDAHRTTNVAAWLADGAPGARDVWRDPADHLVAGLEATLPDGRALTIRPGPRRAVGPDLVALFFGTRDRFGTITEATLRVHPRGQARADAAPFSFPRTAGLTTGEARLLDAIARELAR